MSLKHVLQLIIAVLLMQASYSQDSLTASTIKLVSAYPQKVYAKAGQLEQKLDKRTMKIFRQLQKQEKKMKLKLGKMDPAKAEMVFGDVDSTYGELERKLKTPAGQAYIPSLDTMASSLKFLQSSNLLPSAGSQQQLGEAIAKVEAVGAGFQKAEDLKRMIKERRAFLKDQLQRLGFAKELKRLHKRSYYYGRQVNEYKSMLSEQKKAEQKVLELLSGTRPFKDFMRRNSMLASLFRLPGNAGDPFSQANLAGLQTRTQVNSLLQQQLAAGGADARQQFSQNLQAAQTELNQLKDKVVKAGGSSSDEELPDFKPNSQKTKSFLDRIETGTNIQSQKSNGYLPVTSDIGLSAGYKLDDRSIIGLGASYKLGFGKSIRHIRITHQGFGLRSFVDWKIKGSLWLSGGFEMNYRSEFKTIEELKALDAWQKNGLIGLSKLISLKTKLFRKTRLVLLWDFLSYRQVPISQPVIFRVEYKF